MVFRLRQDTLVAEFMTGIPFLNMTKQGVFNLTDSPRKVSIEVSFVQGSPQIEIIAADSKGYIAYLL